MNFTGIQNEKPWIFERYTAKNNKSSPNVTRYYLCNTSTRTSDGGQVTCVCFNIWMPNVFSFQGISNFKNFVVGKFICCLWQFVVCECDILQGGFIYKRNAHIEKQTWYFIIVGLAPMKKLAFPGLKVRTNKLISFSIYSSWYSS